MPPGLRAGSRQDAHTLEPGNALGSPAPGRGVRERDRPEPQPETDSRICSSTPSLTSQEKIYKPANEGHRNETCCIAWKMTATLKVASPATSFLSWGERGGRRDGDPAGHLPLRVWRRLIHRRPRQTSESANHLGLDAQGLSEISRHCFCASHQGGAARWRP